MGTRLSLLVAGLILVLTHSTTQASPRIEHWTTDNGVRVYFVAARELPMLDIHMVFDAGSARDADKPGLARLTNSLILEGASQFSADDIASRFEGWGARVSTESHRDMASLSLRTLTDEGKLKPALNLLAGIVAGPGFPNEALERNRKRMLVELRARQQSPSDIAEEAFFKALYQDHPYASPVNGNEDSLKSLKRRDLMDFYRQYYVASNAVIVMVGNLHRKQARHVARTLARGMPRGQAAAPLPDVKLPDKGRHIHIDHPSSQTHILMGQPGLRRNDPDYFPLYVGNHVLGGSGLVSRISEEIREQRGLAYSAYSYFHPMRKAGPFMAGLQTRSGQAQEALKVLRSTLDDFIRTGPTEKELKASQQNITGGFPLRLSSNRKIIGNLAMIAFYDLPLDYLKTFSKQVRRLKAQQIQAAFSRRLFPERMVVVTVGPPLAQ